LSHRRLRRVTRPTHPDVHLRHDQGHGHDGVAKAEPGPGRAAFPLGDVPQAPTVRARMATRHVAGRSWWVQERWFQVRIGRLRARSVLLTALTLTYCFNSRAGMLSETVPQKFVLDRGSLTFWRGRPRVAAWGRHGSNLLRPTAYSALQVPVCQRRDSTTPALARDAAAARCRTRRASWLSMPAAQSACGTWPSVI